MLYQHISCERTIQFSCTPRGLKSRLYTWSYQPRGLKSMLYTWSYQPRGLKSMLYTWSYQPKRQHCVKDCSIHSSNNSPSHSLYVALSTACNNLNLSQEVLLQNPLQPPAYRHQLPFQKTGEGKRGKESDKQR